MNSPSLWCCWLHPRHLYCFEIHCVPSKRNYGKASRKPCCLMRFVATKVKHLIWQELTVQAASSCWANCVLKACRLVLRTWIQIAIETMLWMVVKFLGQPAMPTVWAHCIFIITNVVGKNINFKILYNDAALHMPLLSSAPQSTGINPHPLGLSKLIQYKLWQRRAGKSSDVGMRHVYYFGNIQNSSESGLINELTWIIWFGLKKKRYTHQPVISPEISFKAQYQNRNSTT